MLAQQTQETGGPEGVERGQEEAGSSASLPSGP